MDPQLIKNVLSLPIMIMMVLVFLAIIAISITNTVYYKKLWDENGSEAISEESAKVFFFVNLFLSIICGIVFFIFLYRWYKLYNISTLEIASMTPLPAPDSSTTPRRRTVRNVRGYNLSPISEASEIDEVFDDATEDAMANENVTLMTPPMMIPRPSMMSPYLSDRSPAFSRTPLGLNTSTSKDFSSSSPKRKLSYDSESDVTRTYEVISSP